MKVKLIISILVGIFLIGIVYSSHNNKSKYVNTEFYYEGGDKTFQIEFLDLKNSQIEIDKNLFNSYSIPYIRFDGESYEDICLDLIRTKIPNKDISDFMNLYRYNNEINGTIKEIFYDNYNEIKKIPFCNTINT